METEETLKIQNIDEYDPSKVQNEVLADDWRIVMAWWSARKKNPSFKYSRRELISLAKKIYREILSRVASGSMKHEFKPDEMDDDSRELFNIVSKSAALRVVEPHAAWIYRGYETLLLYSHDLSNIIGIPLLLTGEKAYGMITILSCSEISSSDVKSLYGKHRFSESEIEELGLDDRKIYACEFSLSPFDEPIPYSQESPPSHPLLNFNKSLSEDLLKTDLSIIDDKYVSSLSNTALLSLDEELHELVKEQGKISEDILNAHIFIWREMDLRGLPHNIDDELSRKTRFWIEEYPAPKKALITLNDVLNAFPETLELSNPSLRIYLCGGIVNRGWSTNDVDIRIASRSRDPDIESEILSQINNNYVREKVSFIWDEEGGIGNSILLYEAGGLKKDGATLFRPFQPTKPGEEFYTEQDLYEEWVAQRLGHGIFIQPKFDGMSFMVHIDRQAGIVKIFTEDEMRERSKAFKESSTEALDIDAKSAILVAEAVEYSNEVINNDESKLYKKYRQIERESLIKWIAADPKSLDDSRVVFHVHDILYLDGEDLTGLGYGERFEKLKKVVPGNLKHFEPVESKLVHSKQEFEEALTWARKFPNSEGAVLKSGSYMFKVSARNVQRSKEFVKIKNLKDICVMVFDAHPVEDAPGNYNYKAYVGPLSEQDLRSGWDESNIREWKGKKYLKIGTTYNVKAKLEDGSILEVTPIRIRVYEEGGKKFLTWMFPRVSAPRPDKHEPDPLSVALRIAEYGSGYMGKTSILIKLQDCPYSEDDSVCRLKHKIKIVEVAKSIDQVEVEGLQYPVEICRLAAFYKCKYIKSYYYKVKVIKAEPDKPKEIQKEFKVTGEVEERSNIEKELDEAVSTIIKKIKEKAEKERSEEKDLDLELKKKKLELIQKWLELNQ